MSINREKEPVQKPEEQIQQKPGMISRRELIISGSTLAVGLWVGWKVNDAWVRGVAKASAAVPMPEASVAEGIPEPKTSPRPGAAVAKTEVDLTPTITATGTKVEAAQQLTATQTRVSETATQVSTPSPTGTPRAAETGTSTPEPTKVKEIVKGGVSLINIPEKVDSKFVDVAKGAFKNTIGLGTEAFVGEPGGLLVGPDFGSKSKLNPYGYNPEGWDAMYNAGGSIKPFSSVTQEVIRWSGEAHQNLPEGGFVFISAGQMTLEVGDVKIKLPYKKGNNYFFVARGVYSDGHQDTDQNREVKLTDYKPGFVEVTMYESREKSNTAFVSEGQFLQKAGTSHSGGTNCGAEGCSGLTAVFYDANTGAVSIVEQSQGRFGNPKEGWKAVWSNWR